jgi:hypothetical protein
LTLKSCIVHNTDANRCGCPHHISQADFHRKEVTSTSMPPISRLVGTEQLEGPVTVVWETTRVSPFERKSVAVEVRNKEKTISLI